MKMNESWVAENLAELAGALAKAEDSRLIEGFLRSLLTPAEAADIAARWALVKALQEKIPQREIARRFGMSLCKITRGSRELKKPQSPFKEMLGLLEE